MDTFLSASELKELADTVERFNDYFGDNDLTLETTVVDSNGEFVGYIRFNTNDMAYVFVDDPSVLE